MNQSLSVAPGPIVTSRWRPFAIHLGSNVLIALLTAALIFLVWYPQPYTALAGGAGLFLIIVGIDVVMGPMLTAIIASPGKPLKEFRRDLAVIVLLQLAAFGYGLYAMAMGRPIGVSFEIDRFRVVSAADIDPKMLAEAQTPLRSLPWTGPRLIAADKPTDPAEQVRSIELGLAGFDLSFVPRYWREYDAPHRALAWQKARPVAALVAKYPTLQGAVNQVAVSAGQTSEALRFLPIQSRRATSVALLAGPDARIVGVLDVDGFFP